MSELTCPKCHGVMRQYERGGVTVDQCTECRGIFLDRGELERLVDAETRWHDGGQQAAPPPPPQQQPPQQPPPQQQPPQQQPPYQQPPQRGYDSGYGRQSPPPGYGRHGSPPPGYGRHGSPPPGYGGHGGHNRRKRSFLDDLFD